MSAATSTLRWFSRIQVLLHTVELLDLGPRHRFISEAPYLDTGIAYLSRQLLYCKDGGYGNCFKKILTASIVDGAIQAIA